VAFVAAAAGALLPLALHQRSTGAARFISETSLLRRVAEVPKQFMTGYHGPAVIALTIVTALAIAYALLRLAVAAPGPERHRSLLLGTLGLAAIAAPVALAAIGPDYLLARNLLPAWLPVGVAVAGGLAARGAAREGAAAAALVCAIGLVFVIATDFDGRYQRDDWRGAARGLGAPNQPRAIIVTPASGRIPLLLYLHGAEPVPPQGVDVKELDYIGLAPRLPGQAPNPPRPPVLAIPTFGEFARKEGETYTVIREGTAVPFHVQPDVGVSPLDGRPAVALYQPYPPR